MSDFINASCAKKISVVLLLWCLVPNAFAEVLSVQLDGAKERIHLDLDQGAFYVGNDCSPLFYFEKKSDRKTRYKSAGGTEYRVLHNTARSAFKVGMTPRLPEAIIVDGDQVEIVSVSGSGTSRARGKALSDLTFRSRAASRKCS